MIRDIPDIIRDVISAHPQVHYLGHYSQNAGAELTHCKQYAYMERLHGTYRRNGITVIPLHPQVHDLGHYSQNAGGELTHCKQ